MSSSFETDAYPGKPKILFIGLGESSHTLSWIELLQGSSLNVRLFALPSGVPPESWKIKTYITAYGYRAVDQVTRADFHGQGRVGRFARKSAARLLSRDWSPEDPVAKWLAEVIRTWQPDIIHTLGLEAAGEYFYNVRRKHRLEGLGKWVLQLRGGSDLALAHMDPVRSRSITEVLRACDQLLSDNFQNFQIAREMGVREEQFAKIGTVPGTGGIDVEALASRWQGQPSSRRIIIWPKVYEVQWSKALPVYEALELCWDRIQPCEVHMLAMTPEAHAYFWALPERIRKGCRVHDRIPRTETLEAMTRARVMLAPSLVDGVPNSMYEAMAAGAMPIVSPLNTIRPVVADGENVLFARNLYPEEIAAALVRAMTDDALVDAAAQRNLALVGRIANRKEIRARVIGFYEQVAGVARTLSE